MQAKLIAVDCWLHAGYFPTHTLTEDYALGMEMRRKGWRGMYVEDELVRGSAPDKIRAAFGQRSRWCKVGSCMCTLAPASICVGGWGRRRLRAAFGPRSCCYDAQRHRLLVWSALVTEAPVGHELLLGHVLQRCLVC